MRTKRKFQSLRLIILVTIGIIITNCNTNTQNNVKTNDFNCIIEYFCAGDLWNTVKCQLILNDTIAVLRVQSWEQSLNNNYSHLSLNKKSADCFKSLFHEIYSEHSSALKDGFLNERNVNGSTQEDLSISLTLNNKRINEYFHVLDILDSYKNYNPFRPQFYKIRELIIAIILRFEKKDVYNNNEYQIVPDWIKEKFHDEYYDYYFDTNNFSKFI